MNKSRLTLSIGLACLSSSLHAQIQDDPSQSGPDEAFRRGCLLYGQSKFNEALVPLESAAIQGHQDAAYLSARLLSYQVSPKDFSTQSQKYLLQGAKQGHLASIRFLYQQGEWLSEGERAQWKLRYYNQLIELGATQPANAYFRLSRYHKREGELALSEYELQQAVTFDLSAAWLEYARHQPPKEAKSIYVSEAEKGSVPAIRQVIGTLEKDGQFDEAFHWREASAKRGDLLALASLGFIYHGHSDRYAFVEPDLAKAYAYYSLYLDRAGTDRFGLLYQRVVDNVNTLPHVLSSELLADAEALAHSWVSSSAPYYYHDVLWEQANCSAR
ncbi:sel1 repeat family protein [Vibrio crassostreae]|uniref:sel1 repeat family protein n=1 Tax=Vibrio crassostreae TaxID=246167 RepID=UPI001049877E|nr:sel1 repeat family protein [Vibrio crassostreae]TCT61626.1 TPR repeat protein [Vibrio crassostreae]